MSTQYQSLGFRPQVACASTQGVALRGGQNRRRFFRFPQQEVAIETEQAPLTPDELTPAQRRLLKCVTQGRRAYSDKQLRRFSSRELTAIDRDHQRAKRVLHELRVQELPETKLVRALFPHVGLGLLPEDYHVKHFPLRVVRISERQYVEALIDHELLPRDFYAR